jgi:hypothetical protein
MDDSKESLDRWLWYAVWGAALLVVAALAAALVLWWSGLKARRAAPPLLPPGPAKVRQAAAQSPRPRPPASLPPSPKEEAKASAFEGKPLSWGVAGNQRLYLQEPPPPGARIYLVVMNPEREVLGTLFLNLDGPVLPSRYLIKDAAWGQTKRFGGDDVLLGVVASSLPPNGSAFQRAAGSEAWWQGTLKPAFQMDY